MTQHDGQVEGSIAEEEIGGDQRHETTLDWRTATDLMLRKGRCKHQIQYLSQKFDLVTFSELARLDLSPERQVDHKGCSTVSSCVAYNVDMASYRTIHQTTHCDCPFLGVPYDELVDLIEKGEIPLVSIEYGQGSVAQPTLQLHKRKRGLRYTAISHVWADGLGNPTENTLPACQLSFLAARLNDLHGSTKVHTVRSHYAAEMLTV